MDQSQSSPCLALGDKIHVVTRRLFEEDLRRHFVGECVAVDENLLRAEGHAFVFDPSRNEYHKRPERRTRLFSLAGSGLIITVLPPETQLDAVKYQTSKGRLVVTDGAGFELDINEFGPRS